MFGNFGITSYTIDNFVTKLLTTALVRVKAAAHCRTFMRLAGLKPLRPEV